MMMKMMPPKPDSRSTRTPSSFTRKRLAVSLLLIALGGGMIATIFLAKPLRNLVVFHICLFGSGTFIWAGLFHPFRRTILGAIFGTILHVGLWMYVMANYFFTD